MAKPEIMDRIAQYEELLEQAHTLGTALRNEMLELPASQPEDENKKRGLSWRIAESCGHVITAQTYARKFRHFANENLKEELV